MWSSLQIDECITIKIVRANRDEINFMKKKKKNLFIQIHDGSYYIEVDVHFLNFILPVKKH